VSAEGQVNDLFRELLQAVSSQTAAAPMVTGTAGGGAVTVQMEGCERVTAIAISAEAAGDPELLCDLVAAAVNDALAKARSISLESAQQLLAHLPSGLSKIGDQPEQHERAGRQSDGQTD
jgi:DNA-binding protein YbaB